MARTDKYGKRIYNNRISAVMRDYREDFNYNREWWLERMGVGGDNEYLHVQFKNGEYMTIYADSPYWEDNTTFPRLNAADIAYISRYYGDGIETTTAADFEVDIDLIKVYEAGEEIFSYEMSQYEHDELMRAAIESDADDITAEWLRLCRVLAENMMSE